MIRRLLQQPIRDRMPRATLRLIDDGALTRAYDWRVYEATA